MPRRRSGNRVRGVAKLWAKLCDRARHHEECSDCAGWLSGAAMATTKVLRRAAARRFPHRAAPSADAPPVDDLISEVLVRQVDGEPAEEVAESLSLPIGRMHALVRRHREWDGWSMLNGRGPTLRERREMADLYLHGASGREIARRYATTRETLNRVLAWAGVELRPRVEDMGLWCVAKRALGFSVEEMSVFLGVDEDRVRGHLRAYELVSASRAPDAGSADEPLDVRAARLLLDRGADAPAIGAVLGLSRQQAYRYAARADRP